MDLTCYIIIILSTIAGLFNLISTSPYDRPYSSSSRFTEEPEIFKKDLIAWFNGRTVQIGNVSDEDLKAIINSLKQIIRPESARFPRIKVFNYKFKTSHTVDQVVGENNEAEAAVREVLVYTDPEEEKQWIVNIEDLDLRQNLIIFRLGDLGFGFSKDGTYVVLRKTMSKTESFHYFHLCYLMNRRKGKGLKEVEWDNIRPKDLLPIPLTFKEPKDVHQTHCLSRECSLTEEIFGTCAIVKLSCENLKELRVYGHDKERMDSLIREKEPFIFELAKSLGVNKKYLKREDIPHAKRSLSEGSFEHGLGLHMNHHSVKKDNAAAANVQEAQQPTMVVVQKESLVPENAGMKMSDSSGSGGPPAMMKTVEAEPAPGSTAAAAANVAAAVAVVDSLNEPHSKTITQAQNVTISSEPSATAEGEQVSHLQKRAEPKTKLSSVKSPLTKRNEKLKETLGVDVLHSEKPSKSAEESEEHPGTYFEKILDKIRSSPPAKYTVRPLECVGCEAMGTFFSEYEESALVAYIANNIVHDIFTDTSSVVFSPEGQKILEQHPIVPYVGYGTCPYAVQTISRAPKSTEMDDLIDYYSETLGVDCDERDCDSQRAKTKMRELLTSKYHFLEIWPDMSIRLNKSSMLPKCQILSTNEFKQFMISLLFSAYTAEYHLKILSRSEYDIGNFQTKGQSLRMKFQTMIILRVLDELVKSFPHHIIKGGRFLLQILEDKYLALVAEHLAILKFNFKGNEDERMRFKILNKNDRIQALALKDFIIHGVASLAKSGSGSLSAFTTFYNHNRERISRLLVEFGVDRRRSVPEGRDARANHKKSGEDYETELFKRVWSEDSHGTKRETPSRILVELDDEGDIVGS